MRAVLTTLGSTGDVEPMFALALELKRAGHAPMMAISPNFLPRAQRLGLEAVPVGAEITDELKQRLGAALLGTASRGEQVRLFLSAVCPNLSGMFAELLALCRKADVLVSTTFQPAARMVFDTLALPFASVHLSPFGHLGGKEVRDASAPLINQVRAEEGLPPLRDPLGLDAFSPRLALFAVSGAVVPSTASWPKHHRLTGSFFVDPVGWVPAPELEEFLAGPDRPAVIGFGSMVHQDPSALTRTVLDAVAEAGCRAVIQQGWTGLSAKALPEGVRLEGFVPHAWLFERAGCVVHHGGAGTTAACFRAGVPSMVVPHTLEQPLWGELARSLGCAAAVVPYQELTASKLAEGLRRALTSSMVRQSAQEVGTRVRAEGGVTTARALLEELVGREVTADGKPGLR